MTTTTKINPTPAFVIKSRTLTPYNEFPPHTKIFINVLTDPTIPSPESDFEPHVTFPLIMQNKWEIPIYVTFDSLKPVTDKKGQASLYINCIINDRCMRWCLLNQDLLTILKEWFLESVEFRFVDLMLEIDRESMTIPKLTYKGDKQEIIDMEIDLKAMTSVNSLYEEKMMNNGGEEEEEDDMMDLDMKEPEKIIKLQRLDVAQQEQEDDALGEITLDDLMGRNKVKPNGTSRPLIQVIEDMTISAPTAQPEQLPAAATAAADKAAQKQLDKVVDQKKPSANIELTLVKLSPEQTKDNYKILLKFQSTIDKSITDYALSFDSQKHEIHVTVNDTNYSTTKSLVKFPVSIETDENGIKSFFHKKESVLYVYIK